MMVAVMLFLVGCGGTAPKAEAPKAEAPKAEAPKAEAPKTDAKKVYKIAIMPKLVGIPYFNQTADGAQKAGKDLGVEVIYVGPTKADAAEQVKMLEDLISKGVDAICVAPNDPAAVIPVIQKAKKAGILVLDWDTPTGSDLIDASIHQIDDKVLGEHLVDKLVQYMKTDDAEFAIVTGGLSAGNLNTWIDHGLAHAKAKYPKLKLVTDKIPSDEKQQEAYAKTLDLLKAYPNIKGILGYSTVAPLGVAQAIREKGLQDKIAVVGTAVEADSQDFLKDGALDCGVLWDPAKLGYLTIGVAKALLDGKKLENGMDIEGFGKIEVQKDGKTVIMGPPSDYEKK